MDTCAVSASLQLRRRRTLLAITVCRRRVWECVARVGGKRADKGRLFAFSDRLLAQSSAGRREGAGV